ncbi:hypothetical protein CL629_04360 [bacterium]|nr:hypothetical protein [bacterium]|tara:strand:+ start:350 stop:1936 length:1587 start_codon:yes stop_codon:yes gene_type:complete
MKSSSAKLYPVGGTTKRTALGSFMNILGYLVTVFQQIVFIPIFLWAWDKALYGEWLILSSLLAYLSTSHFGMGTYIRNRLTQAYAKGAHKEYARILKSAFGIFSSIFAVFFIILIALAIFFPFFELFDIHTAGEISVRITVFILGLYILLGVLSGLVGSLYTTIGEYPRQAAIRNIRELILMLFVVIVLVLGGEFISVALVYLLTLIGITLFAGLDIQRRHPEIRKSLGMVSIDWRLAKSFLKPGFVFLLIPFSRMIYVQGSVILIGAVFGASKVVVFSVHRTLSHIAKRFVSVITPAILPELTAGEIRGEYQKLRRIHSLFMKFILFVSITATIFLFFGGEDILRFWTRGKVALDPSLWIFLLILIPITAIWESNAVFQVAINKYNKYAASRITSIVIGLLLALVLIKPMGLAGVALGFLIGEVGINFWFVPLNTLRVIRARKRDFVFLVVKGAPLFLLQLLAGWILSSAITNLWFMIIGLGITVTILGMLYTYFLWFDEKEKRLMQTLLSKSIQYLKTKLRRGKAN